MRFAGPWTCCVTAVVACVVLASGCDDNGTAQKHTSTSMAPTVSSRASRPTSSAGSQGSTRSSRSGAALAQLDTLQVKGRAPLTGYSRDRFGVSWIDADSNGCDTRDDVLARELTRIGYAGTSRCVVASGRLADPYTRKRIRFVEGNGDLVDIDHVVALGDAWVTGAFRWPYREREAIANDRMNLLAVDASANRQKGDSDAASWLPPNKSYRCAYVARQIAVKAKYALWVTPAEHAAMVRVLTACPHRPVVPRSTSPLLVPRSLAGPKPSPDDAGTRPGSVYYANCDAVRAAGKAPIHRGEPGYAPHLDRDGDGVGCE